MLDEPLSHTFEHALIVGASGGIGSALVAAIGERGMAKRLTGWSRRPNDGSVSFAGKVAVDITDETFVARAAVALGEVDLVIVATGMLHASGGSHAVMPEKTFRALDATAMEQAFRINTIGPALVAKHVLPLMPRNRRSIFAALSARVGSISDNRLGGWYSYRASKAALNQVIRTLSIELQRTHPQAMCVALHPGTVDTALSAPFQSGVAPERLFTPAVAAGHLLDVVARLQPVDTGGAYDWTGLRVPP